MCACVYVRTNERMNMASLVCENAVQSHRMGNDSADSCVNFTCLGDIVESKRISVSSENRKLDSASAVVASNDLVIVSYSFCLHSHSTTNFVRLFIACMSVSLSLSLLMCVCVWVWMLCASERCHRCVCNISFCTHNTSVTLLMRGHMFHIQMLLRANHLFIHSFSSIQFNFCILANTHCTRTHTRTHSHHTDIGTVTVFTFHLSDWRLVHVWG